MVSASFANVSHYKKWFKRAFFSIADFCLLQAFPAWNLSIDQMYQNRRGDTHVKQKEHNQMGVLLCSCRRVDDIRR